MFKPDKLRSYNDNDINHKLLAILKNVTLIWLSRKALCVYICMNTQQQRLGKLHLMSQSRFYSTHPITIWYRIIWYITDVLIKNNVHIEP